MEAMTQPVVNPALLNRDYTLIIDRSGSMDDPTSSANRTSRWKSCEESVVAVARKINEFDPDGITLYTFATSFTRHNNVLPDAVKSVFTNQSPNGSTKLSLVLDDAFNNYFGRRSAGKAQPNGEMFVVVTDGRPDSDDESKVADVITRATKKLSGPRELSVVFIQVGEDTHAKEFLHNLDDNLENAGAKYDIVSTITMDDMGSRNLSDVVSQAILEQKL